MLCRSVTLQRLSAFFAFLKDNRAIVRKENPNYTVAEIAKALGVMYRGLPKACREEYVKKAAEYNAAHLPKVDKLKVHVDPKVQKKRLSQFAKCNPYLMFFKEVRPELQKRSMSTKQMGKKAGLMWRELPLHRKKVYEEKGKRMREQILGY